MENDLLQVCEVRLTYKSHIKASQRYVITSSEDAYKLLRGQYDDDTLEYKEYFKVVLLSTASKVLGIVTISEGGVIGTVVDVKQILQAAILANATGILLSHNHPTRNAKPSEEDRRMTRKIEEAAKIMQIRVMDHIIVCDESYFSFKDEGLL